MLDLLLFFFLEGKYKLKCLLTPAVVGEYGSSLRQLLDRNLKYKILL